MVREETWEAFVADSLLYAKVCDYDLCDYDLCETFADTECVFVDATDLSYWCFVGYGLSSCDLVLCHFLRWGLC